MGTKTGCRTLVCRFVGCSVAINFEAGVWRRSERYRNVLWHLPQQKQQQVMLQERLVAPAAAGTLSKSVERAPATTETGPFCGSRCTRKSPKSYREEPMRATHPPDERYTT